MLINIVYVNKRKSTKKIARESNRILGIEDSGKLVEFRGMLISYQKNEIRINTLLKDDEDLSFLAVLIEKVFMGMDIGISGIEDRSLLPDIEGVRLHWI